MYTTEQDHTIPLHVVITLEKEHDHIDGKDCLDFYNFVIAHDITTHCDYAINTALRRAAPAIGLFLVTLTGTDAEISQSITDLTTGYTDSTVSPQLLSVTRGCSTYPRN